MDTEIIIAGVVHGPGLLSTESFTYFQGFLQPKITKNTLLILEGGLHGLLKHPGINYEKSKYWKFLYSAHPRLAEFALRMGLDIYTYDPRTQIQTMVDVHSRGNMISMHLNGKVTFEIDSTSYDSFEKAVAEGDYSLIVAEGATAAIKDALVVNQNMVTLFDKAVVQQIEQHKGMYPQIVVFVGYHHVLNLKRLFPNPDYKYMRLFNEKNEKWKLDTVSEYAKLLI